MAETLSVEDVNKMRVAMGLKPIPVPGESGLEFQAADDEEEDGEKVSTYDTREAAAGSNWERMEAERKEKEARHKKKDQIRKARELAARNAIIQGSGIADVEDDLGATDWLKSMKKRQSKIDAEEKRRKEEETQKVQAIYDSKDLQGIRVAHQIDDIEGDGILTFKDRAIDEGDSDEEFELESRELTEKAALEKRLKAKKGIQAYNPVEELEGSGDVLSKYDEEISGPKQSRFTIGREKEATEAYQVHEAAQPRGIVVSLDSLLDDKIQSDYKKEKEIKIKKPKKTKKTSRKRARDEDDDIFPTNGAMDIDIPVAVPKAKKRNLNDNIFDDDEDLAAQLAKTRREALKKRKATATDIAKQIKETQETEMQGIEDTVEGKDGGLVLDESVQWADNLDPAARLAEEQEEAERRRREASAKTPKPGTEPGEDEDEMEVENYAEVAETQEAAERAARTPSASPPPDATGLGEEEGIGDGLAATLKMLKDRHLVEPASNDSTSWSSRQKFLADKARREEESAFRAQQARQRERDRQGNMSNIERDELNRQANSARDHQNSRQLAELFSKEYKPVINLKYTDDYGNNLNQKEAFKELSHQFHGKGSGKQKQEKRLKKLEDEKKRMGQSLLNVNSTGGKGDGKTKREAGVRLQ